MHRGDARVQRDGDQREEEPPLVSVRVRDRVRIGVRVRAAATSIPSYRSGP